MAARRELFLSIGVKASFADQLLSNEAASSNLEQIIQDAGVINGCEESIGKMLLSVAELKLTPFVLKNRQALLDYIVSGKISTQPQIAAAILYFKRRSSAEELDLADFDQSCGVGIVVTPQDIAEAVAALIQQERDVLIERRYSVSVGALQGRLRSLLPFADGKQLTTELNRQIVELLGPKTEQDNRKPKKTKAPKKKPVEKPKTEEEQIETMEDIEKHFTGRVIDAAVNPAEILAEHQRITGGKIRTRFPPEPNGFLHIGHAKAMNFNFEFASSKGGSTFLRYDDTNPTAEEQRYVESIQENCQWLGHKPSKVTFSSDYFETLYGYAVELIKRGKAYVCGQSSVEMQAARALKQRQPPSPWRDTDVQENLNKFQRMREGVYAEGEVCLRMKMDIRSPNPCLWDPVAYRIKYEAHPHVGDQWCIYPSYDFTHCLVDSIEHITQSLCTLEFEVRRDSYYWLLEALDLYRPMVWEYSRLNITYNVLSKRKLKTLVVDNHVNGWDDPRLLTINGLRRRGFTPTSINDFCSRVGVTRSANTIRKELLDACLRQELDDTAPRTMVVIDPIKVTLLNFGEEEEETITVQNHPKKPELGVHEVKLSKHVYIERSDFRMQDSKNYYGLAPGKQVKLKFAHPITCSKVIKDADGNVVELECTIDKSNKDKFKGMLHWVSGKNVMSAEVLEYNKLFLVEDPASDEDWLSTLNPKSLVRHPNAKADAYLASTKPQEHYQFERIGYFVVDFDSTSERLVFNQAVSLRESKEKRDL